MKLFTCIVVAVLFTASARAQSKESDFCTSRTTEAYHSPKCDWGWVHDPHRVEVLKISHEPKYHTYSRWMVGQRTYIFAYRDVDQQPSDMAADIYVAGGNGYKLVGSVEHLGEIVTGVSEVKLTGAGPDVVFREDCGELKCVVVVRFSDETARQVFRYGASKMDVLLEPKPVIIATSTLANQVEQFAWDPQTEKFRKIKQHGETQLAQPRQAPCDWPLLICPVGGCRVSETSGRIWVPDPLVFKGRHPAA